MPKRPSSRSKTPATGRVLRERRAPPGLPGSLSWVKSLLGRPVALERREGKLHVALVDRRRSPEQVEADALDALRSELHARLVAGELDHAARAMRHLVFVLDALGRGWDAVAELPSTVLHKAATQAQRLVDDEASPLLAELIDRLRLLKVAAEVREDNAGTAAPHAVLHESPGALETREMSADDYEAAQSSWPGTIPQVLVVPPGDDSR